VKARHAEHWLSPLLWIPHVAERTGELVRSERFLPTFAEMVTELERPRDHVNPIRQLPKPPVPARLFDKGAANGSAALLEPG
jgi:hypothetical protein